MPTKGSTRSFTTLLAKHRRWNHGCCGCCSTPTFLAKIWRCFCAQIHIRSLPSLTRYRALAPPLFSEALVLFLCAYIYVASPHSPDIDPHCHQNVRLGYATPCPSPFLVHAPAHDELGRFNTPTSNYFPTPIYAKPFSGTCNFPPVHKSQVQKNVKFTEVATTGTRTTPDLETFLYRLFGRIKCSCYMSLVLYHSFINRQRLTRTIAPYKCITKCIQYWFDSPTQATDSRHTAVIHRGKILPQEPEQR